MSYGFRKPTGTDLISTGDDDITHNAEVSAGLFDEVLDVTRSGPFYRHMTTVPDGADFNDYRFWSRNGVHQLGGSQTYHNAPSRQAGVPGLFFVATTQNNDTYQLVIWRDDNGMFERYQTGPASWSPWMERTNQPFSRHQGTVPNLYDLDDYWRPWHMGVHVLGATSDYVNGPHRPTPETGEFIVIPSGTGDCWQRVIWREGQGVYERERENTSGRWTPWRDVSQHAWDRLAGRIEAIEGAAPTQTVWELTEAWTSVWAGEAYLDRLGGTLITAGTTYEGRPIRALRIGNPTLPTLLIQAGLHGYERANREGVLKWARHALDTADTWSSSFCLLIVPTVNMDRMFLARENARGADLNRDWQSMISREVRALHSLYEQHDIIAAIDCHEHDRHLPQALLAHDPAGPAPIAAVGEAMTSSMMSALWNAGYGVGPWEDASGNPEVFRNAVGPLYGATGILIETPGGGTGEQPPETRVGMLQVALTRALDYVHDNLADFIAAKASA